MSLSSPRRKKSSQQLLRTTFYISARAKQLLMEMADRNNIAMSAMVEKLIIERERHASEST